MRAIKKQGGFTLVEIAIVLVIIGLLLAGVLKGQEMIENGRVKSAATDLNGVAAAYNSYLDRYKAMPGDNGPTANITPRGGVWATMTGGDGNGILVATAATTFNPAVGAENELFFRHLRAAGYLAGDPAATAVNALPLNAWGGRTGVVNAITQGRPVAKLQVCMGNVPGKSAAALDRQLDDGVTTTGNFRATLGANNIAPAVAAAAATVYIEDQVYTVCRDL
ncbi:MAG: type II secretion system protein [Polaromonas sp.]|nr:type II secretion system protein [Polaromonas sp.]